MNPSGVGLGLMISNLLAKKEDLDNKIKSIKSTT
jgi:hypothetical protein